MHKPKPSTFTFREALDQDRIKNKPKGNKVSPEVAPIVPPRSLFSSILLSPILREEDEKVEKPKCGGCRIM